MRVAHVLGLDLELVVLGVHEHVHRVGEVGVGALLLVEDDLVHLVVGLEDDFGAGVVEQALQLHAHGGGVAAAAAVFGLEHDHRVLALHDDVAGADFLSDFHGDDVPGWEAAHARRAWTSAAAAHARRAKPRILAFSPATKPMQPASLRSACASQAVAPAPRSAPPCARASRRRAPAAAARRCRSSARTAAHGAASRAARRQEAVEEGVELGAVRVVVLRVDLPDERRAGPERAHQRVFAAHEVEVAAPEQAVEVGLREPRQRARRAARPRAGAGPRRPCTCCRAPAPGGTSSSVGAGRQRTEPGVDRRRAA